jgi:hypothetical protein
MPLPPTRYIDAGPGVPLANPNAAMAEGEAMARVGKSVQQVADVGFKVGEQLRRIDDAGKLASLFTNIEKEASDFSLGLMARDDTDKWKQEYAEKASSWKQTGAEANLSPEGRAIFEQRFLNWDTDQSIRLATVQANKTMEIGRSRISNGMAFYEGQGNYDASRALLTDARAVGLVNGAEHEKGVMELSNREAEYHLREEIQADPNGFLARAEANTLLPGETLDMHERGVKLAKAQVRDNLLGTQGRILNGIADGTLDTPEKIAAQGGDLGAADVAELQHKLSLRGDAVEKQRLARPEVQAGLIGEISATLRTLAPDDTDGQVALQRQIADLPTGEIKNKLSGEFGALIKGETVEAKSYADFVMGQLDAAYDAGRFGKPGKPDNIATADLVKDGFLKDTGKIQRLGFSESQAEDIAEAAKKDPAAGQKKFIDLWNDRDLGSVNASEIEIATAKALKEGNATVGWDNPASVTERLSTAQRYGLAKMKMTEYLKLNPQAKKEEIDKQFLKITGAGVMEDAKRKLVPDRPGRIDPSTSMVLPEKLKPLSSVFKAEADKHGMDPRFLAAISMHETANGTSSAFRNKNNAMGVSNSSGPISFTESADSIARMARVLASGKGPYKGARTVAEIAKIYAPAGADNDPNDLNKHWTAGVTKYLRQLGGDPDKIFINS